VDSRATGTHPASGAALWLPPLEPHYVTNVGNGDLRIIAIEVKNG
jgi:mannose-6-phosphate isomerase-like protein (cupin superfamily)